MALLESPAISAALREGPLSDAVEVAGADLLQGAASLAGQLCVAGRRSFGRKASAGFG